MRSTPPVAKTVFTWLKANLGKGCLAVLTGADYRALMAAVQLVELYSYCPDREAVAKAFRIAVEQMQPSARELAFHAVAHVLDWNDRFIVWELAGLPAFERIRVCAYGPGGKGGASC